MRRQRHVDVDLPWEGGQWGALSVETIINNLETNPSRLEWTQEVTGLKIAFIRHPDVEFFTAGSPHMNVGMACNDCHMPDVKIRNRTFSSHNLMSPLKADMAACKRCHYDTTEELRTTVLEIQNANASALITAGYKTATAAKLIELAKASVETSAADVQPAYEQAVGHYRGALYRVIFMGAENSMGFHNPAEGQRILADAAAEADATAAILRDLLTSRGVEVPAEVPLQLRTYLDNRGAHQKGFAAAQYIPDPAGIAQTTWPVSLAALLQ
ncbi:MAG: ammonia-forming cytochrome c nitrite reductase subunit c552 [Coriobacteriia bacterium]|nr:ammonia-forming cytochrome c nitrite reductase subunit c552 [Coriobacteriia bacterium]